jgi:hypothetical protein
LTRILGAEDNRIRIPPAIRRSIGVTAHSLRSQRNPQKQKGRVEPPFTAFCPDRAAQSLNNRDIQNENPIQNAGRVKSEPPSEE